MEIKRLLYLIVIGLLFGFSSCKKSEDTVTPEEQALIDDKAIVDYLMTHKFVPYHVGGMQNNIDWKIEEILDTDIQGTESLYDLMGNSHVDTVINKINYKVYYYTFPNTGSGTSPVSSDEIIYVDYNAYNLFGNYSVDDSGLFSDAFNLNGLITGWKIGLMKFSAGTQPTGFPQSCDCDPYRTQIVNPGKGVIFMPSALAYGSSVMRFDIVLYKHEAVATK